MCCRNKHGGLLFYRLVFTRDELISWCLIPRFSALTWETHNRRQKLHVSIICHLAFYANSKLQSRINTKYPFIVQSQFLLYCSWLLWRNIIYRTFKPSHLSQNEYRRFLFFYDFFFFFVILTILDLEALYGLIPFVIRPTQEFVWLGLLTFHQIAK